MRRALLLTTFVAAIGGGAILFLGSSSSADLKYGENTPADLADLADDTWDDFLTAHEGRLDCIPPVTMEADWDLATRGEYRPESATVVVRIPGTPATLRSELIHEFAHHVEFTCSDQADLRTAFLSAQGFPPDTGWYEGATWATTPSEQYAEATVELITERRAHTGGILLTPEAVDVVRKWGRGS